MGDKNGGGRDGRPSFRPSDQPQLNPTQPYLLPSPSLLATFSKSYREKERRGSSDFLAFLRHIFVLYVSKMVSAAAAAKTAKRSRGSMNHDPRSNNALSLSRIHTGKSNDPPLRSNWSSVWKSPLSQQHSADGPHVDILSLTEVKFERILLRKL